MATQKTVLVCPLDWGLGHATRMVPVIEIFLRKGAKVILGADRSPLAFLRQRFPDIHALKLEGYTPEYPARGSMALAMIKAYPAMMTKAKKAMLALDGIIDEHSIDIVISDNRYELCSKKAYSVFVTHQLNIQTPGLSILASPFIKLKINNYIRSYDELWIPDLDGTPNLAGTLSHPSRIPVSNHHYIGPLSRFSLSKTEGKKEQAELVAIVSGPEPQRSIFEQIVLKQATKSGRNTLILQGKPDIHETRYVGVVKLVPHLPDNEMLSYLKRAQVIVCRPGYSSIMDLVQIGKKAIFVPTPGQTEQLYLARRLKRKQLYYSESQKDFDLERSIRKMKDYSGLRIDANYEVLENRADAILSRSN
jgi:UDP:flavonoid glycosyltransferase YjiC (YdhE family)